MKPTPTITLDRCHWDPRHRCLTISSTHFAGGFPRQFSIKSHRTGKTVSFVPVGPEDRLFDQDGWDGEMSIYRPVGITTVEHAVVTHMC